MSHTVLELSHCNNQKTEIVVPTSVKPESPYSLYHTCTFFTAAEAPMRQQPPAIKGNAPLFNGSNNFKSVESKKNNALGLSNSI